MAQEFVLAQNGEKMLSRVYHASSLFFEINNFRITLFTSTLKSLLKGRKLFYFEISLVFYQRHQLGMATLLSEEFNNCKSQEFYCYIHMRTYCWHKYSRYFISVSKSLTRVQFSRIKSLQKSFLFYKLRIFACIKSECFSFTIPNPRLLFMQMLFCEGRNLEKNISATEDVIKVLRKEKY